MTGDAVWFAASLSCRANINAELPDQTCVAAHQLPVATWRATRDLFLACDDAALRSRCSG